LIGPFVGQVHTQPMLVAGDGEALPAVAVLEQRFTTFLERSQRLTRRVRVGLSLVLVVGLAFVASVVDKPVAVGLCGLLVIAPLVWATTALLVPLALLGRSKLAEGAGLTMQAGVHIAVDEQGLTAGALTFDWAMVTSLLEVGDSLVERGVDVGQRRVFQVLLSAKNFDTATARHEALAALATLRAARQPPVG